MNFENLWKWLAGLFAALALIWILTEGFTFGVGPGTPRPPVVRIKNDMRNLATAIESYYIDYRTYPPHGLPLLDYGLFAKQKYAPGSEYFHSVPVTLSTPIAYIASCLTEDLYNGRHKGLFGSEYLGDLPIAYFNLLPGNQGFLLVSVGPDGKFDLRPEHIPLIGDGIPVELAHLIYDPSNGTISSGDIMRSRKGVVTPLSIPPSPGDVNSQH